MAVYTNTHSTMTCPTTIMPLSTHSMNMERKSIFSRSALTTTDSPSLVAPLPQLPNDIIKPAASKSCQTNNTRQTLSPNYSRRRSLVKVMPSLSKKISDRNDISMQKRNYAIDSASKKPSSINTDLSSASVTRNSLKQQQLQPRLMDNGDSPLPHQSAPGVTRRSSLMKTPRRPSSSSYIQTTTSGSDEETNTTRNNGKNGSVLNPTVSSSSSSAAAAATAAPVVPASAPAQKQKQKQHSRLSRGNTSSSVPQLVLSQHRRLSSTLYSVGIVKQNKTETLTSPPPLTKLQNARKTPLGTYSAGTVTSDSGSDGDDAATMDNQQQIHMKQQQQHRAQHSQPQSQKAFRRTNHQRHQPLQHHNDHLLLHQRRTSIASLSPLPHPNGVSSSSSSTLVRRRSFADISPRSSLAPSASSTLSQHHHHHHHHQQQQQQQQQSDQENKQILRNSQSHLRHPSWLDSAGFMRPSKCSICHPPPPKKSVITPPVGMGVPKFGLPPPDATATTATTSTPKYGLERRSSSRNSLVNEKFGKQSHSFGLSSSSLVSMENGKLKNAIPYIDGVARMDQRRRFSLPNPGNTTMDDSKTVTTTATAKKQHGVQKRSSFYNKGAMTNAVDRSSRRFSSSSNRMQTPRTKTGKQLSPDTPILDKDFTHSPSSSSSLTEANTDSTSSSSPNPSPTTAAAESLPPTPIDMKHQMAQLTESDYLKTLDISQCEGYNEAQNIVNGSGLLKLQHSPLPVAKNDDVAQCGGNSGLIQHNVGAFEQLQTFLDLSPTTGTATAYTKDDHHQTNFEIPPASLISEDTSDAAQCASSSSSSTSAPSSSLSEMSLHPQDSSNDTTSTDIYHPTQPSNSVSLKSTPLLLLPPPPPLPSTSTSILSDLEQWTAMVRLTLGRWFTDLNHGRLEHYEKSADGSITTMTITGYVVTMEADLVRPLSSSLDDKIYQHRYTVCLGPEERQHTFAAMSSSSDHWTPDDQVDRCQFKNKSTQCECEFDWINRRHHCRRCGDLFCKTHSTNRLPLFTRKDPNQIKWSRVCDSCCYALVGDSLTKI